MPGVWECPPTYKSPPRLGDIGGCLRIFHQSQINNATVRLTGVFYRESSSTIYMKRPMKKRCRILFAGGLGVSPSFRNPPRLGDLGG